MKFFVLIFIRDFISICIFFYLEIYWQIYIYIWQLIMTYISYLCWKHEEKTGERIDQITFLILIIKRRNDTNRDNDSD